MCIWCEKDPYTGRIIAGPHVRRGAVPGFIPVSYEKTKQNENDPVKKPSHYQGRFGLEAVEVIKNFASCPEQEEGFYWGNAVKYLLRYHSKNGVEDLKKARQNLDWLIETLEKNND
ncbi:DUF3310 domain-containing protein [Streptococcus pneumoniae]|nr:DUF3310 domain-containing protein [Streptococcus pneumoniae]